MFAWGLSVIVGLCAMVKYQVTPGMAAKPPAHIAKTNSTGRGKALVFLHPQCTCSLATVDELQRVTYKAGENLNTTIYIYKPSSEQDSWCIGTRIWEAAKLVPRAKLVVDLDGRAARAYGARSSGQVLLYDTLTGKLIFSGGLTESRGHEGESIGEDAIMEYVRSGVCPIPKTAVFGCLIW